MKVTIERTALLKALGHVHRIVERRNTIPILSNVLMEAHERQLTLKSTDLDLEATESAPADVAQAGASCRKARRSVSNSPATQASFCCGPDGRVSFCRACPLPTFPT